MDIMDNHSATTSPLPAFEAASPLHFFNSNRRSTYYLTVAAILVVAWLLRTRNRSKLELPFYKASLAKWIFDAESLIKDSYCKFRDTVYQIKATEGFQVLVPSNLVGEMKGLPDDVLSQTEAINEVSSLPGNAPDLH
jgi:hypothetical protein